MATKEKVGRRSRTESLYHFAKENIPCFLDFNEAQSYVSRLRLEVSEISNQIKTRESIKPSPNSKIYRSYISWRSRAQRSKNIKICQIDIVTNGFYRLDFERKERSIILSKISETLSVLQLEGHSDKNIESVIRTLKECEDILVGDKNELP